MSKRRPQPPEPDELSEEDSNLLMDAVCAELDALKAEIRATRAALAAEQEHATA